MIELLVAATMMIVVIGAVVTLLLSAMRQQPDVTDRAQQIGDARNALERLTVDLRQGSSADLENAAELGLDTICDTDGRSVPCRVQYTCEDEAGGTFRCLRSVDGTERIIVTGLSSPDVFCVVPSVDGSECGAETIEAEPAYVGVTIEFRAGGQDGKTVLEGGAALHNVALAEEG